MSLQQKKPIIGIKCLAYNHETTIRQCLDGFVKQKTEFPFIAVVHDDASTDRTTEIIREYAAQYPDIIKPIFEEKNLYQNSPRGTIGKIVDSSLRECKYIAICEGDDYWIAPDKLQQQVKFLEEHPEYTMCCTDAVIITNEGETSWSISETDIDLSLENLIKNGGLYIATASIVYRKEVKDDYPQCCVQCSVGDHPLQIMCGLKGKVRYFSKKMVAYRYAMGKSWTARKKNRNVEELLTSWKTSISMLEGLNVYSERKYERYFKEGALHLILQNASNYPAHAKYILNEMLKIIPDCINYADKKSKLKLFLIRHNLVFLWSTLRRIKRN